MAISCWFCGAMFVVQVVMTVWGAKGGMLKYCWKHKRCQCVCVFVESSCFAFAEWLFLRNLTVARIFTRTTNFIRVKQLLFTKILAFLSEVTTSRKKNSLCAQMIFVSREKHNVYCAWQRLGGLGESFAWAHPAPGTKQKTQSHQQIQQAPKRRHTQHMLCLSFKNMFYQRLK